MAIINPEDIEGAPGGYNVAEARIRGLEAENARLIKDVEESSYEIERLDKIIAQLREALGAAQLKIQAAAIEIEGTNYPRKIAEERLKEINILLTEALKGV